MQNSRKLTLVSHNIPGCKNTKFEDTSRGVFANRNSTAIKLEDLLTNSAPQTSFTFDVKKPELQFVGRNKKLKELSAAITCDSELNESGLSPALVEWGSPS
jgi:hypothetical protein